MQLISLEAEQVAGKNSVFASPSLSIIVLCTLSFFLEMIPGIGDAYFNAFYFDPNYLVTRPWTLITYIFLHNGLVHLLFNMLVLYFFGTALERRIGNKQLLAIFFHCRSSIGNRVYLFKSANIQYLAWPNDWRKRSNIRSLCSSYNN